MRTMQYVAVALLSTSLLTAYAANSSANPPPKTTLSTAAAASTTTATPMVTPPAANVSAANTPAATAPTPLAAAQAATNNDNAILPQDDVERFTEALADVKQFYVKDVSDNDLFDNAIRGMLSGLDPHSDYLGPDDLAQLQAQTNGSFAGVGLELSTDNGYIVVVTPIDGSPAAKAGIVSGDYIVKINDKPVMASDINDVVKTLRGAVGTPVKLMIYHKKNNQLKNITLIRDNIKMQSVKSTLLAPGYGYIRIAEFDDPTMNDMATDLKQLVKDNQGQRLKGLILDLRNNPGGLLTSAIDVSDAFLDSTKMGKNKLIVYTVGRVPDAHFEALATPGDLVNGAPIVILINQGTASAAEIVAGALQDQHRAIIMGTNSFGKGSVQTVIPLDKTHAIKITTALYYTPDGRSIQAEGIRPDIIVPMMQVKALPDSKMISMATIKESDLSHHLSAATNAQPNSEKVSALLNDYQLQEALNLLQGLVTAKVEQQTPVPAAAGQ